MGFCRQCIRKGTPESPNTSASCGETLKYPSNQPNNRSVGIVHSGSAQLTEMYEELNPGYRSLKTLDRKNATVSNTSNNYGGAIMNDMSVLHSQTDESVSLNSRKTQESNQRRSSKMNQSLCRPRGREENEGTDPVCLVESSKRLKDAHQKQNRNHGNTLTLIQGDNNELIRGHKSNSTSKRSTVPADGNEKIDRKLTKDTTIHGDSVSSVHTPSFMHDTKRSSNLKNATNKSRYSTGDELTSPVDSATENHQKFVKSLRSSSKTREHRLRQSVSQNDPANRTEIESSTKISEIPEHSKNISSKKVKKVQPVSLASEEEVVSGNTDGTRFNILEQIRPVNVDSEKHKFFVRKFDYNPQFKYAHPLPSSVLSKYMKASDKYLMHAIKIMNNLIKRYGSYEKFEELTGGRLLTKFEIGVLVREYCQREGFADGEIVLNLSEDLLSTASMARMHNHGLLNVKVGEIHESWIEGLMRHELSTHYVRSMNNTMQPWAKREGRRQFEMLPHNPTEEGLASLHTVLLRPEPLLFRNALLYFTIAVASRLSFKELFMKLADYVQDPHRRWEYCMRAKRGQTDTSQPGCFCKDQVYLTGSLNILRHRKKIDFEAMMRLGKVAFEDIDRLKPHGNVDNTRIPSFMKNIKYYRQRLDLILRSNGLSDADFKSSENRRPETMPEDEARYEF